MTRWFNRLAMLTAIAAIVTAEAVSCAALTGSRMGYQAFLMTTGSMRPAIDPGDLVIVRSVDPADIRVGDAITFREPVGSHQLVTHRVTAITQSSDGPVFRTRGDANRVADIWTLHYRDRGWLVVGSIHGIGTALTGLQTLPGRLVVLLLVFGLALGLLLPAEERRPRQPAAPPAGAGEAAA